MALKKVAISGGFDPLHVGHIKHIEAALELGDELIVILARDDQLAMKKGRPFMSYETRKEILEWGLEGKGKVVQNVDKNLTSVESLKLYRPDVYAKGGNTWNINNLPEREVCEELGIEVVFGVGGYEKLQSSSDLLRGRWSQRKREERYTIYDSTLEGFNVSMTLLNKGHSTVGHSHPWPELYTFLEGEGVVELRHKNALCEKPASKGSVVLIPESWFHRVHNTGKIRVVFLCVWKVNEIAGGGYDKLYSSSRFNGSSA